jgi:hypothetical protein
VALIDADDAGSRSTDMAEHSLDYLQIDAEALQSGGDGAAQIVGAPRRDFGEAVNSFLDRGEAADRSAAIGGATALNETDELSTRQDLLYSLPARHFAGYVRSRTQARCI